jgi:LytS/YehU family sensor histidine kinase
VPIPVLSIQPLAENAVKHGVAPRSERGYVRIEAARVADNLRILIENSGGGGGPDSAGTGIGLRNVKRRLEICYGPLASLRFLPGLESTRVELSIPLAKAVSAR